MKNTLKQLILFVLFLTGCSGGTLETRLAAGSEPQKVCAVAVLPFENWTREAQAGVTMQRIFHGALVNTGVVSVRPEGDVSLFRFRHRLLPGELLESAHFEDLREKLEIDAVVQGRLTEVGMVAGRGTADVPFLSVQMDLFSVRDGRLILSTIQRRWGDDYQRVMHFGMVTTVTELMSKVSEEIIQDWREQGVGNCR